MIVADERVARFVSERVGAFIYPPWTAMGIERDGEIAAGVVWNCFTGSNVEMTCAGTGWTREFLQEAGRYAFDQLGCCRVTITTEKLAVVRLALRLGAQVEGHLRDFYGSGRDATMLGILRSEYRYRVET